MYILFIQIVLMTMENDIVLSRARLVGKLIRYHWHLGGDLFVFFFP